MDYIQLIMSSNVQRVPTSFVLEGSEFCDLTEKFETLLSWVLSSSFFELHVLFDIKCSVTISKFHCKFFSILDKFSYFLAG